MARGVFFPPCDHQPIFTQSRMSASSPNQFDAEGWQVYAAFNNYWNKSFDSFLGFWNVPDAPAYWPFNGTDQHVIYLFTGLQSDNWIPFNPVVPVLFDIIQPVLQYGYSDPNGGGAFWGLASWFVTLDGSTLWSDLEHVQEGDKIFGNMTRTGFNSWYIGATVLNSVAETSLTISDVRLISQPWAYVVLEVYAVYQCNEFPTESVVFDGLMLFEGKKHVKPWWQLYRGQTPQVCTENIVRNSTEVITINF